MWVFLPRKTIYETKIFFLQFSCKATSRLPFYNNLVLKGTKGNLFLCIKAPDWKETKVSYELLDLDIINLSQKKLRHNCPWKVSVLKWFFFLPLCLRCFHPPFLRLSIYWRIIKQIRINSETKGNLISTLSMILKKGKGESLVSYKIGSGNIAQYPIFFWHSQPTWSKVNLRKVKTTL